MTWTLSLTEGAAGDWAQPLMERLLENHLTGATRNMESLGASFMTTFGDPDAERSAARKITSLIQETSTVEYTTQFQILAADLDWNDSALRAQYRRGLHWKVKELLSLREDQPSTMTEMISTAIQIDNVRRENEETRPKWKPADKTTSRTTQGSPVTRGVPATDSPDFVSKEVQDQRRKDRLCTKCGKAGHAWRECRTGWKAPPAEPKKEWVRKETKKEKETIKAAKIVTVVTDSESESGKD